MGGLRCFGAILILSCAACNPSNDEALGRLSKLTAAINQLEIVLHIPERERLIIKTAFFVRCLTQ